MQVFRLKSTGKREGKKKKATKIYCLNVILLLTDINMKNDSAGKWRKEILLLWAIIWGYRAAMREGVR